MVILTGRQLEGRKIAGPLVASPFQVEGKSESLRQPFQGSASSRKSARDRSTGNAKNASTPSHEPLSIQLIEGQLSIRCRANEPESSSEAEQANGQ
jgi:hypothetical protein